MSDRTSQYIFGELFRLLGRAPLTKDRRAIAAQMWKLSAEFDTHPNDWECDRELIRLGLAKKGVDEDYPEDGETVLYSGLDYGRR